MKNKPLESTKIQTIITQYSNGVGTETIAANLNIHASTVQKYLKRHKILKPKQKYSCNDEFFNTITNESSYWAGMMMSDGYVMGNRNMFGLHLQECDKDHLRKFLMALQSNHELIHDNHTNAWCIQIYNKQCKQMLSEKFNVIPKKSKITSYPNIPSEFHKHFIRGIIDGDGSITYTTCPTLSLVGSVDLLTKINDIIKSHVNYTMRSNKETPSLCIPNIHKPWFGSLSFYGSVAAQVLDWIYDGSTDNIRLERKYETYLRIFEVNKNKNER